MAGPAGPSPADTTALGAGMAGTSLLAGGGELAAAGVVGLELTNPVGWALLGGSVLYFGWKMLHAANEAANQHGADQPPGAVCNCSTNGPPALPANQPSDRPYANNPDPASVAPGKPFSQAQKKKILDQNKASNGGQLTDDKTGEALVPSSKSQKGVTPPSNEAQVDHVEPANPADPNATPGSNSYGNAQVRSRAGNREKSNN